jgi:hypothetical protein
MLHVIDHYLVPVGYRYFFEPEQLAILTHLDRNDSYTQLGQVLSALTPASVDADQEVLQAIDRCEFRGGGRRSLLQRILSR